MMSIVIKHRFTDAVLFASECDTWKAAADLRYADLRYADLRYADLRHANLHSANLYYADLRSANLRYADLRYADLRYANLHSANLYYANLHSANLRYADLRYADLRYAKNIPVLAERQSSVVPEVGPFWAWKKCRDNVIVKLAIGKNAKRSNATGRKCRAEYVKVLEVIGAEIGVSSHNADVVYKVGETVRCDKWDDNRWNADSGGIHFFLTRAEAEACN
jgi:hypothetical protein